MLPARRNREAAHARRTHDYQGLRVHESSTSIVTEPVAPLLVSAADEATYQALQSEADLARDMLTQAQGQRLAMAQLPVN